MLRALHSNGRCLQSHRLAMGLYATIRWEQNRQTGHPVLYRKVAYKSHDVQTVTSQVQNIDTRSAVYTEITILIVVFGL
jgi:hypothetical protein